MGKWEGAGEGADLLGVEGGEKGVASGRRSRGKDLLDEELEFVSGVSLLDLKLGGERGAEVDFAVEAWVGLIEDLQLRRRLEGLLEEGGEGAGEGDSKSK